MALDAFAGDKDMLTRPDPLIQKLIGRLRHADPVTRRNAAGSLRLHGARAACATPALSRLLEDEDPGVRDEARRALSRLRAEAA
jgi:HEAT repeat protein